jgi:probable phosphoglycerate mutase
MPRAVQTAEIIAPALGDLEIEQVEDLEERRPGECDGMTWEAYRQAYRAEGWRFSVYEPLSPGGESFAEFQVRAASTLSRIATSLAGRTIVVACHGGIIESSMVAFLGIAPSVGAGAMHQPNTSITEWAIDPEARGPRGALPWQLVRYNDAAHLLDELPVA